MREVEAILAQLVVLGIMVYALLLIAGAPFGGARLANRYAQWVWKQSCNLVIWALKLPFTILFGLFKGEKKKKKKKRKR